MQTIEQIPAPTNPAHKYRVRDTSGRVTHAGLTLREAQRIVSAAPIDTDTLRATAATDAQQAVIDGMLAKVETGKLAALLDALDKR